MRPWAIIRTNPAVWLSPVLIYVAVKYALMLPAAVSAPYPLALTTVSAWTIAIIAPVSAACAAWEGGRFRRARWTSLPHVRSWLVITSNVLLPALVVGWAALLAAVGFRFMDANAVGVPDLRVVLIAAAIVAAQTLLGFAIGLRVAPVVAVPAVLIGGFTWMVVPSAVHPLWLRHLTGIWGTCCSPSQGLAPDAALGAVAVAGGMVITALLLIRRQAGMLGLWAATTPLLASVALGGLLVHNLGRTPTVDRDGSSLVCSSSAVQVCVWPEHRDELAEVSDIAIAATAAWSAAGVPAPAGYTEQGTASRPGNFRSFEISPGIPRTDILLSLATSLLPPPPTCPAQANRPAHLGGAAYPFLLAWLTDVAGLPDIDPAREFSPTVVGVVTTVRSWPSELQAEWFATNFAAWTSCDIAPRLSAGS